MALLELHGIETYYGRVQALHGVSLSVDSGEVVALIGSNGAGKTTTLRTISGLLRPARGSISFAGQAITGVSAARRVGLGICQSPEGRRLFGRMTVLDNLGLGAYSRRDSDGIAADLKRVYELFPRLQERSSQIAGTLSGGEQQMLAIGRALMSRPKVLMLDEPSLGLAPILVETIFQIIREINAQGTPILLVEQNAHKALDVAHRAYVLETGAIVKEGGGKELLESEDVARAYLLAAAADVTDEVFNAGTGVETSLNQLCAGLCAAAGHPELEPVHEAPRKVNPVTRRQAGVTRAAERVGFRAEVALDVGLGRLVEWYRTAAGELAEART